MYLFLEFLLQTLNRTKGYWDSFFWLWYNICIIQNKLLHRFFSNNKALFSRIRTSYIIFFFKKRHWKTSLFKKEAIFCYFMVWFYEAVCLGGYLTHRDVANMPNLFLFYFVFIWLRWMAHWDLGFQSKVELFHELYHEFRCLFWWHETDLKTKIYYPTYWASPSIGIYFFHISSMYKWGFRATFFIVLFFLLKIEYF